MDSNKLGMLVKIAKGDDRSLRKYAEESGVDVSILSKIINGSYIPKSTDIFRKLTSKSASPRGNITYKQLVEAADSSKKYQTGMKAGMALYGGAFLSTMGLSFPLMVAGAVGTTVTKELESYKKKKTIIEDGTKEIRRFAETSKALILSSLGAKGISFQIENDKHDVLESEIDTYLRLNNKKNTEYLIRYAYILDEYKSNDYLVKHIPEMFINELVLLAPSDDRKVTIVTNYPETYEYFLSFENKLSYNGNLSVVLVDFDNVRIVNEDYISHYVGHDNSEDFYVV